MTNLIHVPSTLPVLVYNRKPAQNLMVCCNAKAGQKIWSMLPNFRRIMTTGLFPLLSMTMWSLQYQAEQTLLPHNGSHSLMETHTRKEIVEQNHHARFRRINGPVWYNIHYLISFAYWTYWLLNEDDFSIIHQPYGLESPPPLSPSFVLSGNQLSQRSCPDVGKCKKQKLTTLVLPYASLGGTKITSVRDFQQLVGPSQNDAPKFGKTSTAP